MPEFCAEAQSIWPILPFWRWPADFEPSADHGVAMSMNKEASEGVGVDPMLVHCPVMPDWSKYKGQKVDISSRRSIQRVELSCDSNLVVDFFYHDGQFWRAVIPVDGVREVYGQAFNFSEMRTRVTKEGRKVVLDRRGLPKRKIPIAYHVQTRFSMAPSKPVRLYPLGTEEFGAPNHEVAEWVYTIEANGPVGWEFSIRNGMGGHLLSVHRFMSMEDMVFERIAVENQYVTESPPLPIDDQQKQELLRRSVARGTTAGMTERYILLSCWGTNNCTSNPFRILDEVLKYRLRHRLGALFFRLPIAPRLYLRMRGLDVDPQTFKLVREEFAEFIERPEIKKRKRTYVREVIRQRRLALGQDKGSKRETSRES